MKCPICGEQMEKIDVGCQCPVCHLILDVMSLPLKPNFTVSISGLEKIEPLSMVYTGHTENGISYCTGSRPADNRELMTKLNEVIEAVNKMMEVMNKESSKQKNQRTDKQSHCPKSTE